MLGRLASSLRAEGRRHSAPQGMVNQTSILVRSGELTTPGGAYD